MSKHEVPFFADLARYKYMNLIDARRNNLIINSWVKGQATYVEGKWRLISEIVDNTFYVTKEEFSDNETQSLVNLLERVNAGLRK